MYWDILNAWHETGYGIQRLNWIVEQYTFGTEMGNEPKKYIDLSLYSPLPRSSPQKLSEISWFVCMDITSLFVTSTANDSNAQICLHSNIHKWTKPNEQSHNRRPKRPFRMDYAKMAIFILLAFSCLHNTDSHRIVRWVLGITGAHAMVSDAVDEESKDEQDGKTSSQAVEDQNVRFWRKHGRVAVNS